MVLSHRKAEGSSEGKCIEWNPKNRKILATGTTSSEDSGGVIRLLQYEGGKFRTFFSHQVHYGHDVSSLSFTVDGKYLLASLFQSSAEKHPMASIVAINIASTQHGRTYQSHPINYPDTECSSEVMLKFHHRFHFFLSSCKSSRLIWAWNRVDTVWQVISSIDTGSKIRDFSFAMNSNRIVIAGDDNSMAIWSFEHRTSPCFSKLSSIRARCQDNPCLTWINDRYLVTVGNPLSLDLYETLIPTSKINELKTYTRGTHNEVTALHLHLDGKLLASGGSDGLIVLWRIFDKHYQDLHTGPSCFYRYEQTYYDEDPWDISQLDPEDEIEDDIDFTVVRSPSECSLDSFLAGEAGSVLDDTHSGGAMPTSQAESIHETVEVQGGTDAAAAIGDQPATEAGVLAIKAENQQEAGSNTPAEPGLSARQTESVLEMGKKMVAINTESGTLLDRLISSLLWRKFAIGHLVMSQQRKIQREANLQHRGLADLDPTGTK